MKRVKMKFEQDSSDMFDEHGVGGYDALDWKLGVEEVLESVDMELSGFGLEIVLGEDDSDTVFFKVDKKE
jgi:hypothetical protein